MNKKKRIDHWTDGDSGVFTDGTRFRLAGVRAPEKRQKGAGRATRSAAGMSGQTKGYVQVKRVGKSYGRDVVEMSNKHGSINKRLRNRGYRNSGR